MKTPKVRTVDWGPVGLQTYNRTYSRVKADGSKETWEETVKRVVDGNLALVPSKFHLKGEREELYYLLRSFRALPAGRHLWVTGVQNRQFLFNCHSAGWTQKLSDHYAFIFDELMKGGGVGSNYSNRFINKYPPVRHKIDLHIVCDPEHPDYADMVDLLSSDYHYEWPGCFPIQDSREGWVEGLVEVLDSAFEMGRRGKEITLIFDVSRVREKGALIRGFGGTASGPGPLAYMLKQIVKLLNSKLGQRLSSLDHMQIDHLIASCVIAGNVRRSARMSVKYWKDPDIFDFIDCKIDDKRIAHRTTNISIEVDHAFFRAFKRNDSHARKVYDRGVSSMQLSGEPGFWNSSLSQVGEANEIFSPNPCITLDTWIMTTKGPRQVIDLLGKSFSVPYHGDTYSSSKQGFFPTGVKNVFKVTTDNGYSFNCTSDHKILKVLEVSRSEVKTKWAQLSDIKTGDRVAISQHNNLEWNGSGNREEGWLLGNLLGDGTFNGSSAILAYWGENKKHMHHYARNLVLKNVGGRKDIGAFKSVKVAEKQPVRLTSVELKKLADKYNLRDKELSGTIEKTSSNFYKGFLSGWFDADGSVQGNLNKGVSIRLSCSKLGNLIIAQRMLSRLGIISKIYKARAKPGFRKLPDGHGGTKEYFCNGCHELVISKDNIGRFESRVGFVDPNKKAKLKNILESYNRKQYRERFVDTVVSVELLGKAKVFDCQIKQIHEFCGNGVRLHNCSEIILEMFENCNLGHINLDAFYDDSDGAKRAFRLMTRFLIRATFADVISPLQRAVVDKNRRIGVGFFGYQGWVCKQGIKYSESHQSDRIKRLLRCFYKTIREEAREFCMQLRIPECIKVTTVAPTGTIAKLPGKSEGLQAIFGKYFDRLITYSKDSEELKKLAEQGVRIEDSYYEPKTSKVAYFRCKDRLVEEIEELGMDVDLVEDQGEVSLDDCLAIQAMVQREYADNAISFTSNIEPAKSEEDKEKQKKYLYHTIMRYLPELKGTTILVGAGDRPQTPYTRITKEQYDNYDGPKFTAQGELQCGKNACPIK